MNKFDTYPSNLLKDIDVNSYVNPSLHVDIANPEKYIINGLEEAIKSLDYVSQTVLCLYYINNQTCDEISDTLDRISNESMTPDEVENARHAAIWKLKSKSSIETILGFSIGKVRWWYYKSPHPKDNSYPRGLLYAIGINELFFEHLDYDNLSEDQLNGLEYAISLLGEKEQDAINMRFKKGMQFKEVAAAFNRSHEWVRRLLNDAYTMLRKDEFRCYIIDGKKVADDSLDAETGMLKSDMPIGQRSIKSIGLSTKAFNRLYYSGCHTVEQAIRTISHERWYESTRMCGPKTALEIMQKFEELGLVDRYNRGWSGLDQWDGSKMLDELNAEIDNLVKEYDVALDVLIGIRSHLQELITAKRKELGIK